MENLISDNYKVFIFKKSSNGEMKDCEINIEYDKPIVFDKQMKCCLFDLILPDVKLKKPIIEGNFALTYYWCVLDEAKEYGPGIYTRTFHLDQNKYFNMEDLIKDLNDKIELIKNHEEYMRVHFKKVPEDDIIESQTWTSSNIYFIKKDKKIEVHYKTGKVKVKSQKMVFPQEDEFGFKPDPYPVGPPIEILAVFSWIGMNQELENVLSIPKVLRDMRKIGENSPLNEVTKKYLNNGVDIIVELDYISPSKPEIIQAYCDIVSESYINRKKINLLRTFCFKHKDYDLMNNKIFFVPLRVNEFNSISIQLKDISGHFLYFTEGDIIITLIIKPIEE